MDALFKPRNELAEIVGDLRVGRVGGLLRLGQKRRKLLLAQPLELQFACDDVERQFVVVLLVLRVQLVEHLAIGNQLLLVPLQGGDDLRNVLLHLVVFRAKLGDVTAGFLEQAEQAALLALVHVEALQLGDKLGQHVGNRAGVLGLHVLQNLVGELGNLRLRGVAVFEHRFAVVDVDAIHERQHGGLLLGRQVVKIQRIVLRVHRGLHILLGGRGRRFLLDRRFLNGRGGLLRGFLTGENQRRNGFIVHNKISFLRLPV